MPCLHAEHALWDAAVEVANQGAAMPELKHMAFTTSKLAQKYGNPIPPSEELEPTDRELFNSLVPALQRMRATRVHAESLMKLALLESTSKAMLRALHQDQNEMPGDISYTGTTWQRWAQQGQVTPGKDGRGAQCHQPAYSRGCAGQRPARGMNSPAAWPQASSRLSGSITASSALRKSASVMVRFAQASNMPVRKSASAEFRCSSSTSMPGARLYC
jgi:hypothetical protein